MKQEKIFSKFNTRTYNNEVEEVLLNKSFSETAKNSLLNTIYKIEESYNDYKTVKIEVEEKRYYLSRILELIRKYCNSIQIMKPSELKGKKYIIDYEKGKIKTISNNSWLLYAIFKILKENRKYKSEIDVIEKKPIFDFLIQGYNINSTEVLRDFNGWSWVTSLDEIEEINSNVIYQNLLLLLGNKFMEDFIQNTIKNKDDFLEQLEYKLKRKYQKESAEEIINQLQKISIIDISNSNEEYKQVLIDIKQKKIEELNLMENKREFLKEISNIKKSNMERIRKIDTIVSDRELLKQEYKLRNSILKNNEKIFSISYLVEILKEERKKTLEKIAEVNVFMEPKVYVKRKEEIKNIINMITIDEEQQLPNSENMLEMQRIFIKCFINKIDNLSEKNDIINNLCEVRYYINLLYNEDKYIKDIVELNQDIENLKNKIIEKVLEYKLIFKFSEDDVLNKKILMYILNTRIIDLQTIYIQIEEDIKDMQIKIFDEENELITIEKVSKKEIEYKNIKINKKNKLFI